MNGKHGGEEGSMEEAIDKILRDGIKRAVIIDLQGSATYSEIEKSLKSVNLEPVEEAILEKVLDLISNPNEGFKFIIKDGEFGIECTKILETLDDISKTSEKFLFTKKEEGGFKIEAIKEPQE